MPYSFALDPHHPIIVLRLIGQVEPDTVNRMFNDCARLMQQMDSYTDLVIDFGDAVLQSTSRFTQAVIIFHRSSPGIKTNARIKYAFAGRCHALEKVVHELGKLGFHVPCFDTKEDAVNHLVIQANSIP